MSPFDDTPRREPQPGGAPRTHDWMYWVIGGVVLGLVVVGLITYNGGKDDRQARDKAAQLTQKLEQAGLRVPQDQDIIINSLGNDGGAVCDNPGKSLGKAVLFDTLTNGASFVGRRPVIVDRRALKGQAVIMEVYCPDKLKQYQDAIDDLKTDNTIKE
jgi:hypothetical protein